MNETTIGTYPPGCLDELAERAIGLIPARGRAIVGIVGSPGSGKTTLARDVAQRVNAVLGAASHGAPKAAGDARVVPPGAAGDARVVPPALHVPMDGFHLANATLDALGRRDRKGAIDTFDGWGFVALLKRLAAETDHTVYAPEFERVVDEPVAGAIAIEPGTRLVVVEGNYLLADEDPWSLVPGLLAESWFCGASESDRMRRLVDRHQRHGRSPEAARAWATEVDGVNARLVEETRARATLVLTLAGGAGRGSVGSGEAGSAS